MTLEWRAQLSVGNDLIDADHQHLIGIINSAEHSLKAKNMGGLTMVLDSLFSYSKIHFSREEMIASAVGYTDVAQLHASHETLLTKLTEMKQEIGDRLTDSAGEHFTAFLRDWLINHVIKEDMKMKPFLAKHSPRFDPRK
ncbi:bacteriohemerythrin [Rhodoferax sp.]|uniref:bacteriohemerythrin n=1 Tax=Rhodoferax sp. TaxID=50421 RepID=UPI002757DF9A|nr:hemerythrin family protein [Rhodoferax sp.]